MNNKRKMKKKKKKRKENRKQILWNAAKVVLTEIYSTGCKYKKRRKI
jgi:hypothetical protein